MSAAEEAFAFAWKLRGLKGSDMVREHRFHPERLWRFDFAFPSQRVAIEIDGRGKGSKNALGRHQTVTGVRGDCEKHNEAVRLGWRVLRFPATDKAQVNDWVRIVTEVLCNTEPANE